MFGVKKGKTPPNSIDSLIGAGTRIDGNVTFSGGLRVDGEVHGNISSESGEQGTVVISEKASVEGSISVGHVVINGTVIGPVFAGESLELLPAARVTGDVEYHQIEMQQGAVIQGRLVHQTSVKAVELKLATSN
ncbi:polymer-forming cytoskeletal protein [Propionivibrio sp.]|uniref:bactofilin family protein n=1 Tax=Propionivibrio sp. TaxID=2212460 RepID=UPI0025D1A5A7|nr:polymer-forming cytoskeletal protein [Propionivibrio sp.]MBK7354518.1 polymer-forming cytoskeletal protein [Propionivibrio sp.]MBK8401887.1 polymer-forming cytoskeletal protein [Propionivibrio sp.]MBK8743702.1 polymer-forming cytoskeletal protein [Propionivibrio sp.]MBK8895562.1 polymer-forming cytoskeletal protein [Propionivibrio sp.]MBL0206774.1 polymer-forming cytoskeletal protein [Propionivibrio sp.]